MKICTCCPETLLGRGPSQGSYRPLRFLATLPERKVVRAVAEPKDKPKHKMLTPDEIEAHRQGANEKAAAGAHLRPTPEAPTLEDDFWEAR